MAFKNAFAVAGDTWQWWDTDQRANATFLSIGEVLIHATDDGWELIGNTPFPDGKPAYLFFKKPA